MRRYIARWPLLSWFTNFALTFATAGLMALVAMVAVHHAVH
jgi:hypothetical protein